MPLYVAFLRGINVGGNNMLPMKELAALLSGEGFTDLATYIQSGNVVFRSARAGATSLEKRIARAVAKRWAFEPRVLVLSVDELERAAKRNPFPQADASPKALHLFFLSKKPAAASVRALAETAARGEALELDGKVLYLYTPNGFGTSKLAGRAERILGVDATARNWRTVTRVLEMATELS